jgi:hypothetical protein
MGLGSCPFCDRASTEQRPGWGMQRAAPLERHSLLSIRTVFLYARAGGEGNVGVGKGEKDTPTGKQRSVTIA